MGIGYHLYPDKTGMAIFDNHPKFVQPRNSRPVNEQGDKGFGNCCPGPGLIFHSDQGVQYAREDFRRYLRKYDIRQSMSNKGNCGISRAVRHYDNAVTKSFFHTPKTEHVYIHIFQTREQARESIFEYIEIFNDRRRKHLALGYKTPIEIINLKRVA